MRYVDNKGERERERGREGTQNRESDIKREEVMQRTKGEHVKLLGGRCDSPKQESNHLKQRFNEAAWGA